MFLKEVRVSRRVVASTEMSIFQFRRAEVVVRRKHKLKKTVSELTCEKR